MTKTNDRFFSKKQTFWNFRENNISECPKIVIFEKLFFLFSKKKNDFRFFPLVFFLQKLLGDVVFIKLVSSHIPILNFPKIPKIALRKSCGEFKDAKIYRCLKLCGCSRFWKISDYFSVFFSRKNHWFSGLILFQTVRCYPHTLLYCSSAICDRNMQELCFYRSRFS